MKKLLALLLLLPFFTFAQQQESTPLDAAAWIAMEPVDTVVAPLIHAPFVKKAIGKRHVGNYKLPVFQRNFILNKDIKQATLYVCGLGQFVAYLDGVKVGDHFLDPGWTLYDKEAEYVTFDVTSMLKSPAKNPAGSVVQRMIRKEHELRVELGNGFYNVPHGRYNKLEGTYGQPKLRLRLHVEYLSGKETDIVTNGGWQVRESQVTFSSIYGGEDIDLRKDDIWQPVLNLGYDGPRLREQRGTQVVEYGRYGAIKHWQTENGDWVFDFGQNMSGIVEAMLQGHEGQVVTFTPAELLRSDSSVNNKAQGNWQMHVTLGNNLLVQVEPKFSYTGFRYVQVHGAVPEGETNPEGLPLLQQLVAKHTTNVAATAEVGTFTCNDELFNQIHRIIDWAIRSNLQSIPTDCPHREKLGWLEQAHLMMPSMYYRYDLANLYRKLMNDIEASQFVAGQGLGPGAASTSWIGEGHDLEGMIPTIAPYYTNFGWNFDDTPEWGSAFIIAPWYHYEWTGSDELFRAHYPAMKRYIDYLTRRAERNDGILDYGLGDWYDLGPKKPGYAQLTTQGVTATATYYYDLSLMARMARVLGRETDSEQYEALAEKVKKAYNDRFLHLDSCYYDRNSQCANAVSLYMGLVPEEYKMGVLENLVNDVEGRISAINCHNDSLYGWGENGPTVITAGDIGYRYLLMALADGGRNDVIYHMNHRDDVPGYGMQLRKGATSLTESWQALESVSNNHLMLGHILEWLYGYVGGLRQQPGTVGWQHVLIAPHPVGGINDCTVSYKTPAGPIKVHWTVEGNTCNISYSAPKSLDVKVINPMDRL